MDTDLFKVFLSSEIITPLWPRLLLVCLRKEEYEVVHFETLKVKEE